MFTLPGGIVAAVIVIWGLGVIAAAQEQASPKVEGVFRSVLAEQRRAGAR